MTPTDIAYKLANREGLTSLDQEAAKALVVFTHLSNQLMQLTPKTAITESLLEDFKQALQGEVPNSVLFWLTENKIVTPGEG